MLRIDDEFRFRKARLGARFAVNCRGTFGHGKTMGKPEQNGRVPSGKQTSTPENHNCLSGKLTISMAIFYSHGMPWEISSSFAGPLWVDVELDVELVPGSPGTSMAMGESSLSVQSQAVRCNSESCRKELVG